MGMKCTGQSKLSSVWKIHTSLQYLISLINTYFLNKKILFPPFMPSWFSSNLWLNLRIIKSLLWILFYFYLKIAHCAVYAAKESKANIRLLCDKKSHLNGNLAHFSWSESEPNLSPTKSAHLMQSTYFYSLLNITAYPPNWHEMCLVIWDRRISI